MNSLRCALCGGTCGGLHPCTWGSHTCMHAARVSLLHLCTAQWAARPCTTPLSLCSPQNTAHVACACACLSVVVQSLPQCGRTSCDSPPSQRWPHLVLHAPPNHVIMRSYTRDPALPSLFTTRFTTCVCVCVLSCHCRHRAACWRCGMLHNPMQERRCCGMLHNPAAAVLLRAGVSVWSASAVCDREYVPSWRWPFARD
jgi:hypothetical protein